MTNMKELNIDQLDQISGGVIYYNEQDGVYEVIDDSSYNVRASYKDINDALIYCHMNHLTDLEVTSAYLEYVRRYF